MSSRKSVEKKKGAWIAFSHQLTRRILFSWCDDCTQTLPYFCIRRLSSISNFKERADWKCIGNHRSHTGFPGTNVTGAFLCVFRTRVETTRSRTSKRYLENNNNSNEKGAVCAVSQKSHDSLVAKARDTIILEHIIAFFYRKRHEMLSKVTTTRNPKLMYKLQCKNKTFNLAKKSVVWCSSIGSEWSHFVNINFLRHASFNIR